MNKIFLIIATMAAVTLLSVLLADRPAQNTPQIRVSATGVQVNSIAGSTIAGRK